AEAAEEARAQGGDPAFWRYHDALFESGELGESALVAHATRLGLDAERFRVALRGRVHREAIEDDLALADELGVDGTPTLFVNGRALLGVPPQGELLAVVDEELALAREAMARGIAQPDLYGRILDEAQPTMRRAPRPRELPETPREPERARAPLSPNDQRAHVPVPPDAPRRGATSPRLV